MKALLAVALFSLSAYAAVSPVDEIKSLTAQLAKTPSDDALREKIIALALKMKTAPALSKEARRSMVRGGAAIKEASSIADYRAAAVEFEKAALEAPWSGDAYYNLAVARDKAQDFSGALAALKLAKLASPGSQDAEDLATAVEYRMEKAASPEARARQDAEWSKKLDGAQFQYVGANWRLIRINGNSLVFQFRRMHPGHCDCEDRTLCGGPVGEIVSCASIPLVGRRASKACSIPNCRIDYEIAEDGASVIESSDYKLPPGQPPFGPNTYKRVF